MTEGEEADAEDSDDSKRHGDASAEESAPQETASSGEEEAKSSREEGQEDAVEEFRPEQESEEEEAAKGKNEDGTLLHQFTRTSVESQPGSMEDVDMDLPSNSKVVDINGHKTKE